MLQLALGRAGRERDSSLGTRGVEGVGVVGEKGGELTRD